MIAMTTSSSISVSAVRRIRSLVALALQETQAACEDCERKTRRFRDCRRLVAEADVFATDIERQAQTRQVIHVERDRSRIRHQADQRLHLMNRAEVRSDLSAVAERVEIQRRGG